MANKFTIFTVLPLFILTACATSYTNILEQKLAGKSDKEKRIILAVECKNKINEYTKPDNIKSIEHLERMKEICQEMTGRQIKLK